MSEATTGVAHANARVSTIPKLSPPSEGASSAFVELRRSVSASCERNPTTSMPASGIPSRVSSRRTANGSAPATTSRAPVRRRSSGQARRRMWRPLRGSCRPAKTTVWSRPVDDASGGMSTPFGTISHGPPIRWSTRSIRNPQPGIPSRIQPRSPEAWCVVTIGSVASARTATQIAGVMGSWRWSTSNRSRSRTRRMRKNERGLRTMLGSEPFAGTITDRPTGITFSGGWPWRPTRGWSARVNWPGGSLPMTSLTSWPRSSSAAAWSSACSTTAPQNDHENGTTMPIFTPKAYSNDVARTGALRLRLVDEALPGLRERLQLPLVEVTQEEVAHAGEMRGARRGQRTGTIRREAGVEDATILRARLADDQATLLQPVDEAGDTALAQEHRARELAHAQPVLGRALQVEQHLVLRQREPVGRLELPVELVDERRVRAEKPRPGGELERGELFDRRCLHMQLFPCLYKFIASRFSKGITS